VATFGRRPKTDGAEDHGDHKDLVATLQLPGGADGAFANGDLVLPNAPALESI
jgi:hypothetical protein